MIQQDNTVFLLILSLNLQRPLLHIYDYSIISVRKLHKMVGNAKV